MIIDNHPGTDILIAMGRRLVRNAVTGEILGETNVGVKEPTFEQDGGWEIHPLLQGVTFKFWMHPETKAVWVNFKGTLPKEAPWAWELTGFLATEGFSEAKKYLRKRAWGLAFQNGFKFDPQKHGYRWI